jgi:hypothetical protein
MPDDPILLRLLAEACRKLARVFEEPDRKVLWIERAGHWDQLAIEAERRKLRVEPAAASAPGGGN